MNNLPLAGVLLTSALWFSCQAEDENLALPGKPPHFPEPIFSLGSGPRKPSQFELGKAIFYDAALSSDKKVSCGTCHAQVHGFADHNMPLSRGVEGRLGIRNAPGLANLAWNTNFMWDGGITHLDFVPVAPFTHPDEMNLSMSEVVERIASKSSYRAQFKDAFGSDEINDANVLKALSEFMSRLISDHSPYDTYLKTGQGLTESELRGLHLFRQHCTSCHTEPLFSNAGFHRNAWPSSGDAGRAGITQDLADTGRFKVPGLRNVAVTYPYMHDGSAKTLAEVIDHYASLTEQSHQVDPKLPTGMHFNDQEKNDLIEFLNALTDEAFLSNPLFAP